MTKDDGAPKAIRFSREATLEPSAVQDALMAAVGAPPGSEVYIRCFEGQVTEATVKWGVDE